MGDCEEKKSDKMASQLYEVEGKNFGMKLNRLTYQASVEFHES